LYPLLYFKKLIIFLFSYIFSMIKKVVFYTKRKNLEILKMNSIMVKKSKGRK